MKCFFSFAILCLLSFACSDDLAIEGYFWTYDEAKGYVEWTFTKNQIYYFDGSPAAPLKLKTLKDSIIFGNSLEDEDFFAKFKIEKKDDDKTVMLINDYDTIVLNRMESFELYVGYTNNEQMDDLMKIYQLRKLLYCPSTFSSEKGNVPILEPISAPNTKF